MRDHEQAFQDAFERHSDELFRHALMRLSDRDRALELTQECFLRAWEYIARGETIAQYRPFLYRVLNNLVVDEYRRHKTQSLDALLENDIAGSSIEGELLRDEFDLFEDAAVRYDAAKALEILEQLPDHHRAVIVMRYIDGLSPGEIAECLGESENTVSVRIHRGVRKLRDLLSSSLKTP